MSKRSYGWRPDLPDQRDLHLIFGAEAPVAPSVDLVNELMPPVWDQEDIGSCTAHGGGAGFCFAQAKGGGGAFDPSLLALYFFTRESEGTESYDSGATIRDVVKTMNAAGVPPRLDWPYVTARFAQRPPQVAYDDAKTHEAVKYARVNQDANEMKACLTGGYPIVIGFTVYQSFETSDVNRTGVVPMPKKGKETVLGGHCVLVVGYQLIDGKPYWKIRNSWGANWGDKGYGYMPEQYLLDPNLASDFWAVYTVSSPAPSPTPPKPEPTPPPQPTPPAPPGPSVKDVLDQLQKEQGAWLSDWVAKHSG